MREQMLDGDPAKREAWSAEPSALIYILLVPLNGIYLKHIEAKKNENNKVQ